MFKEITIQRISVGTLFKLVGFGLALTLMPFSLLMGFLAMFGASTVGWNQQPVTGFAGLLSAPLIGLCLTIIFTVLIGSCMALGLWLYSRFRPITLQVKVTNSQAGNE